MKDEGHSTVLFIRSDHLYRSWALCLLSCVIHNAQGYDGLPVLKATYDHTHHSSLPSHCSIFKQPAPATLSPPLRKVISNATAALSSSVPSFSTADCFLVFTCLTQSQMRIPWRRCHPLLCKPCTGVRVWTAPVKRLCSDRSLCRKSLSAQTDVAVTLHSDALLYILHHRRMLPSYSPSLYTLQLCILWSAAAEEGSLLLVITDYEPSPSVIDLSDQYNLPACSTADRQV